MPAKKTAKKAPKQPPTASVSPKPRTKKNVATPKVEDSAKKKSANKIPAKKKTTKKMTPAKVPSPFIEPITKNEAVHLLDTTSGRFSWLIKEIVLPVLVPVAKELGPKLLKEILESAIRSAKNPTAKQGLLFLKRVLF